MPSPSTRFGLLPNNYSRAVLRMAADYAGVFGGRDAELAALDRFLEQDERPYAFLLAPTGRGKTALLLHWLQRLEQRDDWASIFIPISRRYQTAGARTTLSALVEALANFFGDTVQPAAMSPDQLRPLVADYLRRPIEAGRKLLLVLDGLDEAVGWTPGAALFPKILGTGIRVVASARQLAHHAMPEWLAALGWALDRTTTLTLGPLPQHALRQLLLAQGETLAQLVAQPAIVDEIMRLSEGDPLTLRLIVEGLRDGTLVPDRLASQLPGLEAQLASWLADLQQLDQPAAELFLGLCATALGPLRAEDLLQLAPEAFADGRAVQHAAAAVGRFIIGDGSAEHGYVFSHPRLREVYLEHLLAGKRRTALRQRFITWGEEYYRTRAAVLPEYVRQFWIAHLADDGRWDLAREALTNVEKTGVVYRQYWAATRSAAEGSSSGYLADLDLLWLKAEADHDLALGMRCALIASSVRSVSGQMIPDLLLGLIQVGTPEGRWNSAAALAQLRTMADTMNPHDAYPNLKALIKTIPDLPQDTLLECIRALSDVHRQHLLIMLAEGLPLEQARPLVFEAVQDDGCRNLPLQEWTVETMPFLVETLLRLAPELGQPAIRLLVDLLDTLGSNRYHHHGIKPYLARLPGLLTQEQIAWLFEVAIAQQRPMAIAQLAELGGPALVEQALDYLLTLNDTSNDYLRIPALAMLVPHLSDTRIAEVYNAAMASTRSERYDLLGALIPRLPAELARLTFAEVATKLYQWRAHELLRTDLIQRLTPSLVLTLYADICSMRAGNDRDGALYCLAPYLALSAPQTAYDAVTAISSLKTRAEALLWVRWHLTDRWQQMIIEELRQVLTMIARERPALLHELQGSHEYGPQREEPFLLQSIVDEIWQTAAADHMRQLRSRKDCWWFAENPPAVDRERLQRLLIEAIFRLHDESDQVVALKDLIPHLDSSHYGTILAQMQTLTPRSGGYYWDWSWVIARLAPRLPVDYLPSALELVRLRARAGHPGVTLTAFTALTQRMPLEEQPALYGEALTIARTINDAGDARLALLAFAPYLSQDQDEHIYQRACAVIPHLGPHPWLLEDLLTVTARLTDQRRWELAAAAYDILAHSDADPERFVPLLPLLSAERQDTICTLILNWYAARPAPQRQGGEAHTYFKLLEDAAPYVPDRLVEQALSIVRSIPAADAKANGLVILAAWAEDDRQRRIVTEALAAVHEIKERNEQLRLLGRLVQSCSPDLTGPISAQGLEVLLRENEIWDWQLEPFLPYVSRAQHQQVWHAIRQLPYATWRINAWAALLPSTDAVDALAEIMSTLATIEEPLSRIKATATLFPALIQADVPNPTHVIWPILDAASDQIDQLVLEEWDAQDLTRALEQLLSRLPTDQASNLAARFRDLPALRYKRREREELDALTLLVLAPYLPDGHELTLKASEILYQGYWRLGNADEMVESLSRTLTRWYRDDPDKRLLIAHHWQHVLRSMARASRDELLRRLPVLAPWLAVMASEETLADIMRSIEDVTACWP